MLITSVKCTLYSLTICPTVASKPTVQNINQLHTGKKENKNWHSGRMRKKYGKYNGFVCSLENVYPILSVYPKADFL